jgi:hypothetical protein
MNLKQNQHLKLDAFGHTLEYRWSAFGVLLNAFGCSLMRADNSWRQWSFTNKQQMHPLKNIGFFNLAY